MFFGSKFVFNYSDSEDECVSDEEFEEGLNEESHGKSKVLSKKARARRRSTSPESERDKAKHARPKSVSFLSRPDLPRMAMAAPPLQGTTAGAGGPRPKPRSVKTHHWEQSSATKDPVKGRRWRRADTNVISVKFGHLTSAGNMHTGDPVMCDACGAVLSHISRIDDSDQDQTLWRCEFCAHTTPVDTVSEEVPRQDDVTFMLSPAPAVSAAGRAGLDQSLIVFCVDTSGSMCVTTEVPGKVRLRGDRLDRLQALNTERRSQYLPGQRHDVTFVSRLQSTQAAVDYQLGEMAKDHGDRRVAVVCFNSEVTFLGDGSSAPVHYSGDKLRSWEEMKTAGQSVTLPQAITQSRKTLGDKVFDLEEGGQTALGPALLLAVAMAGQVPGSKVIICTDGMANVGLGSLDNIGQDEDLTSATEFYQNVSQLANDSGVTVSVTTIKGTDCKLVELGKVANNTNGQVNTVDPLKLTEEFGNILADATIATNVEATLILHSGLYFREEETDASKLTRQFGNVNKDTEITFEYGIRRTKNKPQHMYENVDKERSSSPMDTASTSNQSKQPEESQTDENKNPDQESTKCGSAAASSSKPTFNMNDLTALPFQLQIRYTDMEGCQGMRVVTQLKPLTRDRKQAEKEMNAALIGAHGAKKSANLALEGAYTGSRLNAYMNQRLLYRNVSQFEEDYDCYLDRVRPVENMLMQRQQQERSTHGRTYSDDEEDDEPMMFCPPTMAAKAGSTRTVQADSSLGRIRNFFKKKAAPKAKVKMERSRECSDYDAQIMYDVIQRSQQRPLPTTPATSTGAAAEKPPEKPTGKPRESSSGESD